MLADFDGVMTSATVVLNGTTVSTHQGGYLPWSAELTGALADGDNVLAVIVDATWLNVPPDGSPAGAAAVDYLQPGGIYRDVTLRVVPEVFLADVFARPSGVLGPGPSLTVQATIDAAVVPPARCGHRRAAGRVRCRGLGVGHRARSRHRPDDHFRSRLTVSARSACGLRARRGCTPCARRSTAPGARADVVEVRTGFREAVFRPTAST